MNKLNKAFTDFAETRKAGAAKIATTAEDKGGLALLTWHHFKVKDSYYKKAAAGKFNVDAAKLEFEKTYKKITFKMSQVEFQREVGRLEVLGELIINDRSNSSTKVNEASILSYSNFQQILKNKY